MLRHGRLLYRAIEIVSVGVQVLDPLILTSLHLVCEVCALRLLEGASLSAGNPPRWLGLSCRSHWLLLILELFVIPVLICDLLLQMLFICLCHFVI